MIRKFEINELETVMKIWLDINIKALILLRQVTGKGIMIH